MLGAVGQSQSLLLDFLATPLEAAALVGAVEDLRAASVLAIA